MATFGPKNISNGMNPTWDAGNLIDRKTGERKMPAIIRGNRMENGIKNSKSKAKGM